MNSQYRLNMDGSDPLAGSNIYVPTVVSSIKQTLIWACFLKHQKYDLQTKKMDNSCVRLREIFLLRWIKENPLPRESTRAGCL
jgi:hypothetical protein